MRFHTVCFLFFLTSLANDSLAEFAVTPDCSDFYAGRITKLSINRAEPGERLLWRLAYSGKTIAAGESVVPNSGKMEISFKFPKLADGVVADAELTLSPRKPNTSGIFRKKLFFYGSNPFFGHEKALKTAKIAVWQADGEETLSRWLKELAIPFAEIADPEQADWKTLLVTGVDFEANPDILTTLAKFAAEGKRVFVLNPSPGVAPLPLSNAVAINFSNGEVIKRRYGKKLDHRFWGSAKIADRGVKPAVFADGPGIAVTQNQSETRSAGPTAEGLSFCEIRFPKGSLTLATWRIIRLHTVSPAPALVLRHWLLSESWIREK
jgi:hypothetical protein